MSPVTIKYRLNLVAIQNGNKKIKTQELTHPTESEIQKNLQQKFEQYSLQIVKAWNPAKIRNGSLQAAMSQTSANFGREK